MSRPVELLTLAPVGRDLLVLKTLARDHTIFIDPNREERRQGLLGFSAVWLLIMR